MYNNVVKINIQYKTYNTIYNNMDMVWSLTTSQPPTSHLTHIRPSLFPGPLYSDAEQLYNILYILKMLLKLAPKAIHQTGNKIRFD